MGLSSSTHKNNKTEILRQGWVYKYSKHLKKKRKRWMVILKIQNPFEIILLTYNCNINKDKLQKSKPTLVLRNTNKCDISSYYGKLNASKNEYHFKVKSKYDPKHVFECADNGLDRRLEKLVWMSYLENGLANVSESEAKQQANHEKGYDSKQKETYPTTLEDVVQDLQTNEELPPVNLHLPHYDFKLSDDDTKEMKDDFENEIENKVPFEINIYDAQSGAYCESKNDCKHLLSTKKIKTFNKLNKETIQHILKCKHKRKMCSQGNKCQYFKHVQRHYISNNKMELCDKFHCRLYYHPASRIQSMIDVGVEYNVGDSLTVFQCRGHCDALATKVFHSTGLPVSFDHTDQIMLM